MKPCSTWTCTVRVYLIIKWTAISFPIKSINQALNKSRCGCGHLIPTESPLCLSTSTIHNTVSINTPAQTLHAIFMALTTTTQQQKNHFHLERHISDNRDHLVHWQFTLITTHSQIQIRCCWRFVYMRRSVHVRWYLCHLLDKLRIITFYIMLYWCWSIGNFVYTTAMPSHTTFERWLCTDCIKTPSKSCNNYMYLKRVILMLCSMIQAKSVCN